jgi:hypothetical protein
MKSEGLIRKAEEEKEVKIDNLVKILPRGFTGRRCTSLLMYLKETVEPVSHFVGASSVHFELRSGLADCNAKFCV